MRVEVAGLLRREEIVRGNMVGVQMRPMRRDINGISLTDHMNGRFSVGYL